MGVEKAKPVILEPIYDIAISVPNDYMGDIMGDLNSRRARINDTSNEGDMSVIKAKVPLSEVVSYSTQLRSITGGEGMYSMEFSNYDVVPAHIQGQIVADSNKDKEAEQSKKISFSKILQK